MSIKNLKHFCPAPWVSLYVEPNGEIKNCCISKSLIGNVNEVPTINDTVNGSINLEIKQMMLNDIPVAGCENCHNQTGPHTLQHHFKTKYKDVSDEFYADITNFKLQYLDVRWNNTCNFACIYCGPKLSSLWAEQRYQVVKMKEVKGELLSYVLESAADITDLYLAGGEPLMLKENEIILTKLLEVNRNCRICINTNLSIVKGNKIVDLLKQFKNVQWLISSEAMNEQYEYIRWPGKWSTFLENLQLVRAIPFHHVTFNMVLMNINALTIWDYIDLLHEEFGIAWPAISINIVNMRDNLSAYAIQRLTDQQRQLVRERISKKDYSAMFGIENVIDSLADNRSDKLGGWNGLEYTVEDFRRLDQDRNLNSRAVFSDIYNVVDNNPRDIPTQYKVINNNPNNSTSERS